MPLIAHDEATTASDAQAIDALHGAFAAQRSDFVANPHSTLEQRSERIGALAMMMMSNRERIRRAVSDDFAVHPELFSDLIECVGIAGRALYAIAQLPSGWPTRSATPIRRCSARARAFVRYQPKGVVGNIVPWNFPFDIGVGPLVEMLAAGNRVIVKPSDFTPACGELLRRHAGVDLRRRPRDHGGRRARAGARPSRPCGGTTCSTRAARPSAGRSRRRRRRTSCPTTLELGGKCPAVVLDDAVDMKTVASILGTKMIKNGQMCISVDYVLVPRARMGEFVALAKQYVRENMPHYSPQR